MIGAEKSYRPSTLADLIGQPKVQRMLSVYIKAANMRHETLDHVLITGPSGCGKTTTASIIANELGEALKVYSGPAIKTVDDLTQILLNVKMGDVIFIDEVHRLGRKCQESLYFAMEQFQIDIMQDGVASRVPIPHFTLIGATNLYGGLNDAMLNRFPIQVKLAKYSDDDMCGIVRKELEHLNIDATGDAIREIASRTRGIPRNAGSLTKRVCDVAMVSGTDVIDIDIVNDAMSMMDIYPFGLNADDVEYLSCLDSVRKTGIDTICLMMNTDKQTVEEKIEPYIMRCGLVMKTARGRVLTERGKELIESVE